MLFGYPALKNDFYNMFELQIHLIHSSTIDCWLCLNQNFSKGQFFLEKLKRMTGLRGSPVGILSVSRRCVLKFATLSSKNVLEELVLSSLRASPLMKPLFTPGGWQVEKWVY